MLRNEKGSFRGSSDQRGEHPSHLHNCRISEHGQPSGVCPTWAPHRGLLLRPGAPGRPGEGRRLQTVPPRGDSETRPGSGDTEAAGPRAGCWGTAPVPDGRELRRARTPRCAQAVSGSSGAALLSPAAAVVNEGGASGDRLPAPTRRHLRRGASTSPPRAAGGWLPARRLAPPPASGDKGINRHARSAGGEGGREKGGALGRLHPPAPPTVASPCARTLGQPRGSAPGQPRQRKAPGAPAVPYCSCNQPGLPQATVMLGATGLSSAATGEGMPGDTLFSHFTAVNLASRRGCPSPPLLLWNPLRALCGSRRCGAPSHP